MQAPRDASRSSGGVKPRSFPPLPTGWSLNKLWFRHLTANDTLPKRSILTFISPPYLARCWYQSAHRSVIRSGSILRRVSVTQQSKQIGLDEDSSSIRWIGSMFLHSRIVPLGLISPGLFSNDSTYIAFPQSAQRFPSYHWVRIVRMRQSSGAASTCSRHFWSQPARSGQREQADKRSSFL